MEAAKIKYPTVKDLILKKVSNRKLAEEVKKYSPEEMRRVDRAFGSVIGAFIGDALGAYLEMRREVTA